MATACDRNPFHCPRCDVLYSSKKPEYDDAPALLPACTHAICKRCVKKERRETAENARKPYTVTCALCSKESLCDPEPDVLLELMAIQNDIEIDIRSAFFGDPDSEARHLRAPKCQSCRKPYSSDHDDSTPFVIPCGHSMCLKCVREKKYVRSEARKAEHNPDKPYKVECYECHRFVCLADINRQDGVLLDVVKWLNKKKEEHIESHPENQFSCADCGQMTSCERGYVCVSCSDKEGRKRRELCAFCTCEAHRSHDTERLSPFEEPIKVCYLEGRLVGEMCNALFEEVDKYFTTVIDTIPPGLTYTEEAKIAKLLKEKANDYDETMKKIVASGRLNIQMLEDTLADLKETFPVPQEADGDSMYDEESQAETQRERSDNKEKNNGRVPDERDSSDSNA